MKKIVFAIALLFAAQAAFAATLPAIIISKVDPQPVEPGRDLTTDVTLFNRETGDTGFFSVALDSSFPILFKSASDNLTNINLCGGCKKDFKYFLSIDSSAVSGIYTAYVRAFSAGSGEVRQKVEIKVQGKPNLIFSTESELGNVTPSSKFSVALDITNIGTGQARQIKIQPESSSFIVLGGAIKTLDSLNATETKQAVFDFVAASDLSANSYLVPFRMIYLDEQGSTINATQNLGVRVVNKGEISIQTIKVVASDGSSVITAGRPFTIIARLENVGTGDADSISSQLECPFSEAKKAFLGQLKKDEDAPAVFDVTSSRPGTYACNLTVLFEDDTGSHEFRDSFDVLVNPAGISAVAVLMAIAIIAGLFFFRKRLLAPFAKKERG